MNVKKVTKMLYDVAIQFDVLDDLQKDLKSLHGDEDAIVHMGSLLGLSKQDLLKGIAPVPDTLFHRYNLFSYMSEWKLAEVLTGANAPFRMLRALFGNTYQGPDVPSEEEEKELLIASVRARCDQKLHQINKLFPDTYPLDLPVSEFRISTNTFISFRKVYEMANSWDEALQRFSSLFFAAVKTDLPESEALELNLLSTFFNAVDEVMPQKRITYNHIQQYRDKMQEEGFELFSSYVRIHRVIPFWKAREFYKDSNYLVQYILQHRDSKATIRSFLSKIETYECTYTFINDIEEHQRRQGETESGLEEYDPNIIWDDSDDCPPCYILSEPVLVEKTNAELDQRDRLIAEQGRKIVSSVRNGGAHTVQKYEYSDVSARMLNRFNILPENRKWRIGPIAFKYNDNCTGTREEGDCDE